MSLQQQDSIRTPLETCVQGCGRLPVEQRWGELSWCPHNPGEGGGRGRQRRPWRWSGARQHAAAASSAAPWRPPCRAGVQFQRGDECRLRPAPEKEGSQQVKLRGPRLGPGSTVEGARLWSRGPGERPASAAQGDTRSRTAEGNRGRGWAGVRLAGQAAGAPTPSGRAGAGCGSPPPAG